MPYKTDQNIIGRQVTTEVEEMISGIRICYGAGAGLRTGSILVMPTVYTTAQLVSLFDGLPTVTGTQTLDISGCAGVGALTNPQKAVATGKGWTLDVTP
jgi:hypothetical protein